MNKVIKNIGYTCTICAAIGFTALGAVTLATLIWVMLM